MNNEATESFMITLNDISMKIFVIQFISAIIGVPVNILHLVVCFNLKANSTNTIIISIAFCDLAVFSMVLQERIRQCTGFPTNYTEDYYVYNEAATSVFGQKLQYFYFIAIGVVQILVSIIYPIVATLLLFEIIKAAKTAKRVMSQRNSNEKHKTGQMILVMTVFYVISSAPGGILQFMSLFVYYKPNTVGGIITGYGTIFLSFLYCLTATSHSLICFTMSSEYRKAAKLLIGYEKKDGRSTQLSNTN